jgi:RNA polymerase sigma-70 factor (ECF subfamily)
MAAPSDEALVSRIANGDQAALRTLFQRHCARIHRFALRFVNDSEAAQEIVNDTFLIAWRQAARFEGRSQVATWLLGIARFRALGAVKARRLTSESLDDQHEATLVDPTERVDARMQREEQDGRLKACIAALPPEQGQLVEMHYFRDVSLKDAAALTGLPLNTVKTRLFLARKKLARMLTREEEEPRNGFSVAHIAGAYRAPMQSAH